MDKGYIKCPHCGTSISKYSLTCYMCGHDIFSQNSNYNQNISSSNDDNYLIEDEIFIFGLHNDHKPPFNFFDYL